MAHQHVKMIHSKHWDDDTMSTSYRWLCAFCCTEGVDIEPWVEPGMYLGNALVDHIADCQRGY